MDICSLCANAVPLSTRWPVFAWDRQLDRGMKPFHSSVDVLHLSQGTASTLLPLAVSKRSKSGPTFWKETPKLLRDTHLMPPSPCAWGYKSIPSYFPPVGGSSNVVRINLYFSCVEGRTGSFGPTISICRAVM